MSLNELRDDCARKQKKGLHCVFTKSVMHKGRIKLTMLIALPACLLFLVGILPAYSSGRLLPFLNADGTRLTDSVSEKVQVTIGGIEQGMFIRGKNLQNPVLLFLHGGPGMPEYFLAEKYAAGLEERFTVCYWEQRGGGISYNPAISPESITAKQLISDAIEVTNYLRERFGQEKIYLLAHSWGSFIGIQTVKQAPELYHAYIGVGQISHMSESERRGYSYMLEQYTAAENTRMVNKLKDYPVLESDDALRSFFTSTLRDKAMHELGIGTMRDMRSVVTGILLPVMKCKAYTLREKVNIWRAKAFLRNSTVLIDQLFATDLTAEVSQVEIPVYLMSGQYDYTVNCDLSKMYLEQLQAPVKGFYTFEQSAHSPLFEEPERFVQILVNDVLNRTTALADAELRGDEQ